MIFLYWLVLVQYGARSTPSCIKDGDGFETHHRWIKLDKCSVTALYANWLCSLIPEWILFLLDMLLCSAGQVVLRRDFILLVCCLFINRKNKSNILIINQLVVILCECVKLMTVVSEYHWGCMICISKVGQGDLFVMWSGFISRCLHARLQICVCTAQRLWFVPVWLVNIQMHIIHAVRPDQLIWVAQPSELKCPSTLHSECEHLSSFLSERHCIIAQL